MIKLYSFGEKFGVQDSSPFVLKVDAYMRMAGIEFESLPDVANLQRSPKGKLPFIDDGGVVVADSSFIFEYLNEKFNDPLDAWLSDEQKAEAYLLAKSLDENFYWCLVYSRWMRDDTWPLISDSYFSSMPIPLRWLVPPIARKGVKNALLKQGMGKHSDAEIMHIAELTLRNLSVLLADKPYFFGDKPSSLDATIFSMVANFVLVSIDNPMNTLAKRFDNLVVYCQRIQHEFYAD